VLVVEDEEGVRRLAEHMLAQLGYQVLSAASGPEALGVAAPHGGPIDLLLTDVVMPQMSGPAVAEALRPRHAGMRVLYMSGYADDAGVRHGALDRGAALLQKPFSMAVLAKKVREVLEGPV
jgi:CheY-like chemotaxis protein